MTSKGPGSSWAFFFAWCESASWLSGGSVVANPYKAPESSQTAEAKASKPNAAISIVYVGVGGLLLLGQLLSLLSGSYKARALNGDEAFGALLATVAIAALSGWLCYHGIKRLKRRS
ncbi:hypothetical protein [Pseudoxanthomonas suwonensis]|uniref:hypothetical protein n=1 Tax=Pseudoxanthomonas suwonensis TaxID=314722 RepID=UPI001184EF1A|nr:hypothetical protein [Pseudoxanthomonas suwonensis]